MRCRLINNVLAALALTLTTASTYAAPSEEELQLLGNSLTPWGAEKAGSADGSYPPYAGDAKPPAGFDKSSGIWPDLYPDEKPLFSIDANNMAQYEDKLMEGLMELMRRYPTFRIDIYPTHRDVWMPEVFIQGTMANARNP